MAKGEAKEVSFQLNEVNFESIAGAFFRFHVTATGQGYQMWVENLQTKKQWGATFENLCSQGIPAVFILSNLKVLYAT